MAEVDRHEVSDRSLVLYLSEVSLVIPGLYGFFRRNCLLYMWAALTPQLSIKGVKKSRLPRGIAFYRERNNSINSLVRLKCAN